MNPKLNDLITKLEAKYKLAGQDINAYIEGLLYSDYVPYWDYIHLDTLLTLQKPKTKIPDEQIFIMYHQVTELYFKMILHELKQISNPELSSKLMTERLIRVNRYFKFLTDSFSVMTEGMEQEQFLLFRMALLPASGFQSAQYRKIELFATDIKHLVHISHRKDYENKTIEACFEKIYWRWGATELESGEKTLTLKQFEEKYDSELLKLAQKLEHTNIWQIANKHDVINNEALKQQLKYLDLNVNVNWPLEHYKTAVKYLHIKNEQVAATGGTNWQGYLPPRFQKRIFYPSLWTEIEKEEWGKAWVEEARKAY